MSHDTGRRATPQIAFRRRKPDAATGVSAWASASLAASVAIPAGPTSTVGSRGSGRIGRPRSRRSPAIVCSAIRRCARAAIVSRSVAPSAPSVGSPAAAARSRIGVERGGGRVLGGDGVHHQRPERQAELAQRRGQLARLACRQLLRQGHDHAAPRARDRAAARRWRGRRGPADPWAWRPGSRRGFAA